MILARFVILAVVSSQSIGCSEVVRLCTFNLNPDVSCRTCDQMGGRGQLIEFFDADTNEIRLFISSDRGDAEIIHPHGRMKGVSDQLNSNEIKFDPTRGDQLIVNALPFPVVLKETREANQ